MLHPHRAVELTMATEARFRSMLAQRVEQQALWDSLVRDIAARHDQLQLRLDLIGGRLGHLQDRLFLLAPSTSQAAEGPTWRALAKRLLRRPANVDVAAPPPDRGVWELFEPVFYRMQVPEAGTDPLRHYLDVGEAQGLRPNPWFDPAFYLAQNEDVAAAGVGAFDHYCRYGGFEGRVASAEFDTAYYLATNPDVRAAGVHPMLHFMLVGRWEGRRPAPQS
jgi:hypothetical protein